MVVFTCNNCGESLQKPKVEKHFSFSCKGPKNVSCVDCFKDFRDEEYVAHIKCVTENQRYGSKDYVEKAKKGEVKQESWMEMIKSILMHEPNITTGCKNLLNNICSFNNVPRKKKKFINFMQSSSGGRASMSDIEGVWDLIEKHKTEKANETVDGKTNVSEEENQLKLDESVNETNMVGDTEPPKKKKKNKSKNKDDSKEDTECVEESIDGPNKNKSKKEKENGVVGDVVKDEKQVFNSGKRKVEGVGNESKLDLPINGEDEPAKKKKKNRNKNKNDSMEDTERTEEEAVDVPKEDKSKKDKENGVVGDVVEDEDQTCNSRNRKVEEVRNESKLDLPINGKDEPAKKKKKNKNKNKNDSKEDTECVETEPTDVPKEDKSKKEKKNGIVGDAVDEDQISNGGKRKEEGIENELKLNLSLNNEDEPPKKKKKNKNVSKENEAPAEEKTVEIIKDESKRKKKQKDSNITKDDAGVDDKINDAENLQKSISMIKEMENGVRNTDDEANGNEILKNSNSVNNELFSLEKEIEDALSKKGSVALKKLEKKVLKKYQDFYGQDISLEKFTKKFNKQLKKIERVTIDNDIVRLNLEHNN